MNDKSPDNKSVPERYLEHSESASETSQGAPLRGVTMNMSSNEMNEDPDA